MLFFAVVLTAGCYYDNEEVLYNCSVDATNTKYSTTVSNILTSYGCLGCHGAGLTGGDSGPKLVGDEFLAGWNSKSVGDLFDFILTKMPDDAPGTLKKDDVASVTAYILQINNIPAGKQELPAEHDALAQIAILAVRP